MSLRLDSQSPRYTQDVDYVMTEGMTRRKTLQELKGLLQRKGITIESEQFNSRGIFLRVSYDEVIARIEVSVAKQLFTLPEQRSTLFLAKKFDLIPQIITVMSRSESYSNKIAASLERSNARDLYDIFLYESQVEFDEKTLESRLSCLNIDRKKSVSISFLEASQLLKKRLEAIQEEKIQEELSSLIPDYELQQIFLLIRAALSRLISRLEIKSRG